MGRPRKYLTLLVILGACLFGAVGSSYAQFCGPFYFQRYQPEALITKAEWALVRLLVYDGQGVVKERGTAFAIDKQEGYFLTAYHVIKAAQETPGYIIKGIHSRSSSREYNFVALEDEARNKKIKNALKELRENHDLAIVRLASSEKPPGLTELELAFSLPEANSLLTLVGYPDFEGNNLALSDTGRVAYNNNEMRMKAGTYYGDSGAPVLDERGLVYGVVIRKNSVIGSFVEPLIWNADSLMVLAPSYDAFNELLSDTSNSQTLNYFLDPAFDDKQISNFQLLSVFRLLIDGQTQIAPALIECPLLQAGSHRQIGTGFIYRLMRSLKLNSKSLASTIGIAFNKDAFNAEQIGNSGLAIQYYEESENVLTEALTMTLTDPANVMTISSCTTATDQPETSLNDIFLKSGFEVTSIDNTANTLSCSTTAALSTVQEARVLFRELSLAKLKIARLSGNKSETSLVEAYWSAAAATVLSGNSLEPFAANVALMGDISYDLDEYENAAQAYSLAWQSGNTGNWVKENFEASVIRISSDPDYVPKTTTENHFMDPVGIENFGDNPDELFLALLEENFGTEREK